MPQGEQFWNPYRMIPVRDAVNRRPPCTGEKFKGKSGVAYCSLENLTPLFVGGNRNNKELFLTREGRPVIPGSSLKGMLRSLAEIVGGGCHITDAKGKHSTMHKACDNGRSLCVTCRMFGMMERGGHARVHTGNIGIGDAFVREEIPKTELFRVLLGSPATRHEPFYRTPPTGTLDGKCRKLYFHQPARTDSVPTISPNLESRAVNIRAIFPDHHFDFEIHFTNLQQDELELLIYASTLEENATVSIGEQEIELNGPLRHKIGYAKPLGLGSCRVTINKLVYFAEPSVRFSTLGDAANSVLEGEALATEIHDLTRAFAADMSATMQQFRKMMIWDVNDQRTFRYPNYHWFKNSDNGGKPLKNV